MTRARDKANSTVTNFASTGIDDNADANAITIDSSENVGIGTSSPAHNLDVTQTGSTSARIGATGSSGDNDGTVIINNGGSGDAMLRFDYEGNTDRARIGVSSSGQQLEFYTAGNNERMRILADGRTIIGHNAAINISILGISNRNATSDRMFAVHNAGGTSGYFNQIAFRNNADSATIGEIVRVNDASVSYNTTSDYRLKTAVNYDWDATTRLKQLKPARFKWIVDGDDAEFVDGFIANEAQTVVPESVTGTKDEVDDAGNPVMQGIDQSKIVPLLTKALIESVAKIEALEARITALEAG